MGKIKCHHFNDEWIDLGSNEMFVQQEQGFRLTCLFTSQYNTKGYDTITDVT